MQSGTTLITQRLSVRIEAMIFILTLFSHIQTSLCQQQQVGTNCKTWQVVKAGVIVGTLCLDYPLISPAVSEIRPMVRPKTSLITCKYKLLSSLVCICHYVRVWMSTAASTSLKMCTNSTSCVCTHTWYMVVDCLTATLGDTGTCLYSGQLTHTHTQRDKQLYQWNIEQKAAGMRTKVTNHKNFLLLLPP